MQRTEKPAGRFRTACSVMAETLVIPASKTIQLYGLQELPGPAKHIHDRSEAFSQKCPTFSKVSSALGWMPIDFALAQAGAFLSKQLSALGPVLADTTAYTAAFVHPSLIALGMRKALGTKEKGASISRYIEAAGLADIVAAPVFFGILSTLVHGGGETISMARGAGSIVAASLTAFAAWAVGFVVYWPKVVRGNSETSAGKALKEIGRGLASSVSVWKAKTPKTDYEEAGTMVGTGFLVWSVPWYLIRAAAAAFVAMQSVPAADFTGAVFSVTAGLGWISSALSGLKLSIIEGILKRRNEESS